MQLFHDHELVATHPRQFRPGSRCTIDEHLPPEAIAYKRRDPQWGLRQSEDIGAACHALIERLFAHRVLDNLRAAQSVIGLARHFGTQRLEAACRCKRPNTTSGVADAPQSTRRLSGSTEAIIDRRDARESRAAERHSRENNPRRNKAEAVDIARGARHR